MKETSLKGEGGYPLTFHRTLTEQYRHITGNKFIQVGWNGHYNMWNILMRGKYIMSFASNNSDAKSRARMHFKKLRSNGYDNVKSDMKKKLDAEAAHTKYLEDQHQAELKEIGNDILIKQKESVFVNGG